jgi:hypothetical protein
MLITCSWCIYDKNLIQFTNFTIFRRCMSLVHNIVTILNLFALTFFRTVGARGQCKLIFHWRLSQ